jgi:hypothetical protein
MCGVCSCYMVTSTKTEKIFLSTLVFVSTALWIWGLLLVRCTFTTRSTPPEKISSSIQYLLLDLSKLLLSLRNEWDVLFLLFNVCLVNINENINLHLYWNYSCLSIVPITCVGHKNLRKKINESILWESIDYMEFTITVLYVLLFFVRCVLNILSVTCIIKHMHVHTCTLFSREWLLNIYSIPLNAF